MSGDGGERSNRRRQNIPSVSIRVLLGRCQPWRERTRRVSRHTGRQTDRQTAVFSFSLQEPKVCLFTDEPRAATKMLPPLGGCVSALLDRHPNKTSQKDDVEKTKKKGKKEKEGAMHFTTAFVFGTGCCFSLGAGRGETLSSELRKHSHIIKITVVCTLQKAQRGQLLSASSNSSSS